MGWIGATIDALHDTRMARKEEKQMQREIERQYEFAQTSVQWKAEDARKAGLHPLFALGAPTQAPSPLRIGGSRGTNFAGNVPDPPSRKKQQTEQAGFSIQEAQIRSLNASAQKDEAIAGYYDSYEARGLGGQNISQDRLQVEEVRQHENVVQLKPQEAIPSKVGDRAQAPFNNPFWERHVVYTNPLTGNDWYILTPRADNPAEGLEGLGATAMTLFGTTAYYLGKTPAFVRKHWTQLSIQYPDAIKQVLKIIDRHFAGKGTVPSIRQYGENQPSRNIKGMNLPMEGFR